MARVRQSERLRAIGAHVLHNPILLDGDASELIATLAAGAAKSNVPTTEQPSSERQAGVVILAIESDGRHSSFTKAARMLRELSDVIASDAIQIVVIQSGRSRIAPASLQRLLSSEILYNVMLAFEQRIPGVTDRTLRQRIGLAALDAAGLRVLRFG